MSSARFSTAVRTSAERGRGWRGNVVCVMRGAEQFEATEGGPIAELGDKENVGEVADITGAGMSMELLRGSLSCRPSAYRKDEVDFGGGGRGLESWALASSAWMNMLFWARGRESSGV